NNEARIIWADSIRKTPYSVVYLHGFSASQMEGDPLHRDFAKRYGANLYLARLAEHGLKDPEAFHHLSPQELLDSAKEALAIGQLLGEKVIIMATSSGCTLATYLAAEQPEWADALIFYSPNIDLANASSAILTYPWGLQVGRLVVGGTHRSFEMSPEAAPYWTTRYRVEGLVALRTLLNQTMKKSTFERVTKPLFLGYYYKNQEEQDDVISVPALLEFFDLVQTPADQKQLVAFKEAKSHVIGSTLTSREFEGVEAATFRFAEQILGLQAINTPD
ncbi:MAG: alpha/beta hydrolase, partial [Phaeodactylibacter sp.]|nr:alpha/beta hydrolase [Phaeodactylibacter sp.]